MMSPLSLETLSPSELESDEIRMGLTRGQAAKFAEMIEHGLLNSSIFGSTRTSAIDDFIKVAGPKIRKELMRLVEERFYPFASEKYTITINYDDRQALFSEINNSPFLRSVVSKIGVSNIPVHGTGVQKKELSIFRYSRRNHHGLLRLMRLSGMEDGFKNGYVFADPLCTLLLAARYPESVSIPGGLDTYFFIGDQKYYLSLYDIGGNSSTFRSVYDGELEKVVSEGSCLVQPDFPY